MVQRYCGKCGNAVQPEDLHCLKCGSPLGLKNGGVELTEPVMPIEQKSSFSPPPVSSSQQQGADDGELIPKPKDEGEKGTRGTPFKTGLLVGGVSGFTFIFINFIFLLGPDLMRCIGLPAAIGAAGTGAGKLGNQFARKKDLALPSGIGEGVGGVIGGLIGLFIIAILLLTGGMAVMRNP